MEKREQMSINTPDWVKDAIFYQIFPDRFAKSSRLSKPTHLEPWASPPTYHGFKGGDLLGVAEKVDYLVDLGVNAIYFNPVFSSASNHRYHTYDYMQIDPLLGGYPAFREMVDVLHANGIRVVLDGVFNHASRGFFQFNHLMECGPDSPYRDWFHVHSWPIRAYGDGAPNYHAWWGMPALPKFNTHTPAVREYLWNVGTYWLEQGIDGWRLDVPNEIDDDQFWREFRRRCLAVRGDCYIVGELWHDAHRWLRGDQFDGTMNYNFARAALGYFIGHGLDQTDTPRTGLGYIHALDGHSFLGELERINNHLYAREIVLANLNLLGSHDTPRMMTMARHDRTGVRLLLLCLLTMPGAPNIYYGDEIGMAGGHDPLCRSAFPWQRSEAWDTALRNELRRYIALRKATPALRRGNFRSVYADSHVVVYQRHHAGQTALVAFNRDVRDHVVRINWPPQAPPRLYDKLDDNEVLTPDMPLLLPGRSGRVWIGEADGAN